jgi:hypothetical protein
MLKVEPTKTFQQYAHTQASKHLFFLLKGEGIIESVDENEVLFWPNPRSELPVKLITGLYFGNA